MEPWTRPRACARHAGAARPHRAGLGRNGRRVPAGGSAMIRLNVNGQAHELDADPEMPLLWAVRDLLGLTGTKYGCGQALCGACTVHLDGEAVRSCVTPISRAAGRKLTTIEGLENRALQDAWCELAGPPGGFGQAGRVMSAA